MSAGVTSSGSPGVAPLAGGSAGSPASPRVRADLRFLRIYSLTTARVMRYRPHPDAVGAPADPRAVADRLELSLAAEARRYRQLGWCILGVLVLPLLLSAVLWSAMYWLPVRIYWWPFERGNYGLPYLSLFEWLAYLILAAYFVLTVGLLHTSHQETRRIGTEYRRIAEFSAAERAVACEVLWDGAHERVRYVVEHSPAIASVCAPEAVLTQVGR